jgi:hypothetical protein
MDDPTRAARRKPVGTEAIDMSRFIRMVLSAVFMVAIVGPSVALAGGPTHSRVSFTYTLADAVADYQAYGDNAGDCGDFVLLVDFDVERLVTTWPDREIREVHFIGHFYNAADTSRSIVRGGDFVLTMRFDADGFPESITRVGVTVYAVIDGQRIVVHAGRDVLSFATGPMSATPKAGADVSPAVCDALR